MGIRVRSRRRFSVVYRVKAPLPQQVKLPMPRRMRLRRMC